MGATEPGPEPTFPKIYALAESGIGTADSAGMQKNCSAARLLRFDLGLFVVHATHQEQIENSQNGISSSRSAGGVQALPAAGALDPVRP